MTSPPGEGWGEDGFHCLPACIKGIRDRMRNRFFIAALGILFSLLSPARAESPTKCLNTPDGKFARTGTQLVCQLIHPLMDEGLLKKRSHGLIVSGEAAFD